MILSASRRTDIPAYYGDWFMNRLREGYALVRNPMNPHQVSRVELSPESTECIVFWTKNPSDNFIEQLHEIDKLGYKYYFQYTITPYLYEIEKNVDNPNRSIERFIKLSKQIGRDKVVWRYDPIFINKEYNLGLHKFAFEFMAERLSLYTDRCVISFLDSYPKIKCNLEKEGIEDVTKEQMLEIAKSFSEIARKYKIELQTCSEEIELSEYGIKHGCCIDLEMINRIAGKKYKALKDKSQRGMCGCIASVDIGAYDTCPNGCIYCYANRGNPNVNYDKYSPILCSEIQEGDKITNRKIITLTEDK